MRMDPDAFLALMDAPNVAETAGDALNDTWVAYHPVAGVFLGFHGDVQMWSNVSPAVATSVTVFTEPEIAFTCLAEALDTYDFGSGAMEMYQVADGTWPSLLAVGLPVQTHMFDLRARMAATHVSTNANH